jgi:hypothetical protein
MSLSKFIVSVDPRFLAFLEKHAAFFNKVGLSSFVGELVGQQLELKLFNSSVSVSNDVKVGGVAEMLRVIPGSDGNSEDALVSVYTHILQVLNKELYEECSEAIQLERTKGRVVATSLFLPLYDKIIKDLLDDHYKKKNGISQAILETFFFTVLQSQFGFGFKQHNPILMLLQDVNPSLTVNGGLSPIPNLLGDFSSERGVLSCRLEIQLLVM